MVSPAILRIWTSRANYTLRGTISTPTSPQLKPAFRPKATKQAPSRQMSVRCTRRGFAFPGSYTNSGCPLTRPRPCPLRSRSVSYTHLRAHETKANLVCRLLLEKKKQTKQTLHTHIV